MKFKKTKEIAETIQAIVSIIAIIVGGVWTYKLFIKGREHYPHANIEQKVSHISLPNDKNLLRVEIGLTNTGTSRLLIKKSLIRIQQILPLPPCTQHNICAVNQINSSLEETERKEDRFSWHLLYKRTKIYEKQLDIEPSEKDVLDFEFVIPSKVEVVRIYSYFRNEKKTTGKDEVGWKLSTYYDFRKTDNEEVK